MSQRPQIAISLSQDSETVSQEIFRPWILSFHPFFEAPQIHRHHRQVLRRRIMQLARNSPALLILGSQQLPRERLHRCFGKIPFRQIAHTAYHPNSLGVLVPDYFAAIKDIGVVAILAEEPVFVGPGSSTLVDHAMDA